MHDKEKMNTQASAASAKVEFCSHTQFGGFLDRIVAHLRARGHDASQYYMISESDYRTSRGTLERLWLRLRMFALFPTRLALHAMLARPGTILVVTSNPFFAPLVARLFARSSVTVVHLLYDLYPDALVYGGKLRNDSPICQLIDRVQRSMLRRCNANVLLGEHLLAHVRSRYGEPHNPVIIHVGADDETFAAPLEHKSTSEMPLRLLYCGNMGYMHDTATLGTALRSMASEDTMSSLDFRFHASGRGYGQFREELAHSGGTTADNIHLAGFLDAQSWSQEMCAADIALVTMKNGSEKVVMPSKTYSAMQAGQAILAIAPAESDLALLVNKHDCGWVIKPGDSQALEALLRSLPQRRDELRRKQENALQAACRHYSGAVVAGHWATLIAQLHSSR